MDTKPIFDPATLAEVVELQLLEQGLGFPFPAVSTLLCCPLGDHLHVIAKEATTLEVHHVRLDRQGHVVGTARNVPLDYVATVAAVAGELVLVGTRPAEERPVVLMMDSQGSVSWHTEIPIEGSLTIWPRPVDVGGRALLTWMTDIETSRLWVAEVGSGSCSVIGTARFDDSTDELDIVAAGNGLALARSHSHGAVLELLRVLEGKVLRREAVVGDAQPLSATIGVVGDHYLVLWISQLGRALHLQCFDWELRPRGASRKIASTRGPTRFRAARLIQGKPGYLAIGYQTITVGDGGMIRRDDGTTTISEPTQNIEQHVAAYNWRSRSVSAFHPVAEPGISYDASGWLGDQLLLIHGAARATISVYRAVVKV